jgi:hypothetical protein
VAEGAIVSPLERSFPVKLGNEAGPGANGVSVLRAGRGIYRIGGSPYRRNPLSFVSGASAKARTGKHDGRDYEPEYRFSRGTLAFIRGFQDESRPISTVAQNSEKKSPEIVLHGHACSSLS